MTPPNRQDPSFERKNASLRLEQVKDRVLDIWIQRVLKSVSSASAQTAVVLRDQVPQLLDDLIANISADIGHVGQAGSIGKEHGEQRANLFDYTFSQVLLEYRILRQVIFEVLEEEKIQTVDVRNTILNVLDDGIEKAIEQFSHIRSEELQRSNTDLENFAAIVAHDLKSPLATISGFGEILHEELRDRLNTEEVEYINAIQRSALNMTQLIDRLLQYSAVGREVKPLEKVDLSKVVQNVVDSLKSSIDQAEAEVHFSNLPIVDGDSSFFGQVFQNFISNALKFRKADTPPDIHITAKEHGPVWLFTIQDNGVGFDPKEKEEIFSLFKRLDRTRSEPGQGIGLATVRKVIEMHGGHIWAESDLNVGSTFYFTLPVKGNVVSLH